MFAKLLIANRGEIACRIMRTAQRMGIHCVAVYSEADSAAQHVKMADSAFLLGPAPSKDSYLRIDRILAIAKEQHVDAIHPGYGFLSENAPFAQRCVDEGIIFIGPSPDAIEKMGSKRLAKVLMQQANVPVTPGYHEADQDEKTLIAAAKKIGYPILIKAAAGGGGKGMRVVREEKEFVDACHSAKREAQASFGDSEIILEKYLETPRHIEVQVFADTQGNCVHLFERDCSLQRRHQKIIEESPPLHIPQATRDALGAAAVQAARAISYVGAGTIEFLLDDDNNSFYFMEMNTRLQVEHPITEMITGVDLVEWQCRIAAGESLPLQQAQLRVNGHAFQARIYAEDPANDFLPATGVIHLLRTPSQNSRVRIDSGVAQGDAISTFYDPLIAKLIVWGETRERALAQLTQALTQFHVVGLKNNIGFLLQVCRHPEFIKGKISTRFIPDHKDQLLTKKTLSAEMFALATVYQVLKQQVITHDNDRFSPWDKKDAWQSSLPAQQIFTYQHDENVINFTLTHHDRDFVFENDALNRWLLTGILHDDQLEATINQQQFHVRVVEFGDDIFIFGLPDVAVIKRFNPQSHYRESGDVAGRLSSPMPGTVVAVLKNAGDNVNKGDKLLVIEAMKMEHTIFAPVAGVVKEIHYQVGDQVMEGCELLIVDQLPTTN